MNRGNPVPLYIRIKNHLDKMISDGRLAPGQRLPSEKELQDQFGVSRITVRQALKELTLQEKIVGIPGKGTFVLEPKVEPLTALTSFSENMRAQGLEPSYGQTKVELSVPSSKIRAVLGLGQAEKAVHIYRLMLADGVPMAIQNEFLPDSIYKLNPRLFTPEVLNGASLYNILERELDIPLLQAEEYVDTSVANPDEAKLLNIEPGNLVLVITRITYTLDDRPVEYVKLIFRADRYRYRVQLFRPR
jgi:GntR family transcriptional regulator